MKLEGLTNIESLQFDIPERTLEWPAPIHCTILRVRLPLIGESMTASGAGGL